MPRESLQHWPRSRSTSRYAIATTLRAPRAATGGIVGAGAALIPRHLTLPPVPRSLPSRGGSRPGKPSSSTGFPPPSACATRGQSGPAPRPPGRPTRPGRPASAASSCPGPGRCRRTCGSSAISSPPLPASGGHIAIGTSSRIASTPLATSRETTPRSSIRNATGVAKIPYSLDSSHRFWITTGNSNPWASALRRFSSGRRGRPG